MFLYRRDRRGIMVFTMIYMFLGFTLANVGIKLGGVFGTLVFTVGAGVIAFLALVGVIVYMFFWDRIRLPAPTSN